MNKIKKHIIKIYKAEIKQILNVALAININKTEKNKPEDLKC